MVWCSRRNTLLEGAFRRAFFYSGQSRQIFLLLAIGLHAALLSVVPARAPLHPDHWQALSVHVESHQPVQMVNIASALARHTVPAFPPVKAKQKTRDTKSDLPQAMAEAVAEAPHNELAAAPPQATPAAAGPVVGLALPQPGAMQGHRRLWSFQQSTTLADEQAWRQAQMQRDAQLALQAIREADRQKFEFELISALRDVPLRSLCRVTISPTSEVRSHCRNDSDANLVGIVLERFAKTIPAQTEANWVAIDLAPRDLAKAEVVMHRSSAELPLQ